MLELLHRLDDISAQHAEWDELEEPSDGGDDFPMVDDSVWRRNAPALLVLAAELIDQAARLIDHGVSAEFELEVAEILVEKWHVLDEVAQLTGTERRDMDRAIAIDLERKQRERTESRIDRVVYGICPPRSLTSPRRRQHPRRRRRTTRRRATRADSDPARPRCSRRGRAAP